MDENLNTHVITIREYLKKYKMICDGAFGTYYSALFDTMELPELANLLYPKRVSKIHKEYVDAGARLIRTNTFASNTVMLAQSLSGVLQNVRMACNLAYSAAEGKAYVAGDIGPIPYENFAMQDQVVEEYIELAKTLIDCKVPVIIFETFSSMEDILPAIHYIKANSDTFVIVQFSVSQFGYSSAGLSARKLFEEACECPEIDATGFNCGVGPGHMVQLMEKIKFTGDTYVTSLPNAGYPKAVSSRMVFTENNMDYFVLKLKDLASFGVDFIGGCCGTTPEYILRLHNEIPIANKPHEQLLSGDDKGKKAVQNNAFFADAKPGKKLIAVELAPPIDSNDEKLMDSAHILMNSGVDVVTFPDSPSGRTRADSILMAEKVQKQTGLRVMPHICCRDKNAIAIRSQLLGAYINEINNFLVITGDPIPSMVRQSIKGVFNFDAVGMMNIIKDMNEEQFINSPLVYGGAINQNRLNLSVEIERVRKKMDAGASFFLTQPIFTKDQADRVRMIKKQTNARILCGIMPFVSAKNASFMKNEMTGIEVPDDIIARYPLQATKEEGEAVGISIAKEVIAMTDEFVDGYYFSFPFNRVYLLEKILLNE
jgi:homocysteine S-methyltransferase